ncbi:hypothetical protein ACFV4G_30200 [Kitasatospora sp. NPDC059747]|uniref:hypothetical protein n=1 Tax=Kitasatospora sp. NPDC059747 TaxID=3346930 RepID=UPI0036569FF4
MHMRRTPGRLAAAAIAAAILSACAGGNPPAPDSADATPQHSAPGAPPAAAYDPPTAFDLTKGVALPVEATRGKVTMAGSIAKPLPLTLDGPTAYIAATDSLQAVDLATGRVKTMITALHQALRPSNQLMDGNPAEAPVIAKVAGKRQAMAAFLTKAAGQGTTADRLVVELATVDTATGTGKQFTRLLDGATGHEVLALGGAGADCRHDGRSVTVCTDDGSVFAVDDNAQVLWKLPDEANHRIAPTVTAVWHGLVYGSTSHGPVILDTRTGADRPATPGIAPAAVDAYAGLALKNDANILVAYPAAG